jgi:hypothetical protein
MKKGAGAAAAIAALLAGAPAALAATQTASSGTVSATFSFQGKLPSFSHQALKIERSGVVAYNHAVTDPACGELCAPASNDPNHPSVQVLDLDRAAEPEVVLSLYTAGANCCTVDQVFSYEPATMSYSKTSRNFGSSGATIKDLNRDGHDEFLSADPAFKYTFTDGAASGEPIQILDFSAGRFVDVTRSYRALIARDAAKWLKAFKQNHQDGVGVLAAWAADEDLLGHSKQVSSYLHQQLKAGHLNSAIGPKYSGKNFITHLQRFLKRLGYSS